MKNTQYKLKSYVKYTLYIFFSLCLFFITVYSFYRTYTSKIVEKITYSVIDNIDYKVYLKDNNFFETPYLEKDSTYISSLIKYIDVVFEYETDYSKPISGKYS